VDRDSYSVGFRRGMEAGNGVLQVADFVTKPSRPSQPPIKFAAILDGLTHTVLVAETRFLENHDCGICDHHGLYHPEFDKPVVLDGRIRQGTDFSEALASLQLGINLRLEEASKEDLELSIGSHHEGGATMVFCDGRVKFVTESIDREILHAIGSRADREVYDQSALQ